jgi:hypothetical protein
MQFLSDCTNECPGFVVRQTERWLIVFAIRQGSDRRSRALLKQVYVIAAKTLDIDVRV